MRKRSISHVLPPDTLSYRARAGEEMLGFAADHVSRALQATSEAQARQQLEQAAIWALSAARQFRAAQRKPR